MRSKKTLLLIMIVAATFRLFKLTNYPSGFHIDEAQIGNNAFSILQTLRDENGAFLPLHTGFFDEARPMLSVYLTVPWISLFGLSVFSTRLTNALLGIAVVYLTYELAKKLFANEQLALISCALMAISPWHIILSRSSADGAIGLAFLLLSNLLLIIFVRRKKGILLLATVASWVLSYFSYTGVRPLLALQPLFWVGFLTIKGRRKAAFAVTASLVLLWVVLLSIAGSDKAFSRYGQIGNISAQLAEVRIFPWFLQDSQGKQPIITTRIFHNKLENSIREFSREYFKYINLNFLFLEGGFPIRFSVPEQPLQYWMEAPFFLYGVYLLIKQKKTESWFLIFLFLSGPIPASLTTEDSPNMQRAAFMLPSYQVIASVGIVRAISWLKNRKKHQRKLAGIAGVAFLLMFSWEINRFIHQSTVHQPLHQPWHRNVEWPQIVEYVSRNEGRYDKIVLSKLGTEPYQFFLFYNRMDPVKAQTLVKSRNVSGDWEFGKIVFSKQACPLHDYEGVEANTLYGNQGECREIPGTAIIKRIRRPDNTVAMQLLADSQDE